jgi:hypothetical protein
MNRNDDFDQTLAAWLRSEAPEAPDRVLDAALERVAAEPQRRGWFDRVQRGAQRGLILRATAVAAVIVVAAFIGLRFTGLIPDVGASSPSPTDVGTPRPTGAADCVKPPHDVASLIDVADPIACYGNTPLTFDATWLGGGVADCPSAPEPAWLACSSFSLQAFGDTRKVGPPQLFVAVDPSVSVSLSEPFAQVRVTGHFDDPAAQTCRDTQLGDAESLAPAAETIERCRSTFVVTEVTEVSDPSASPSPSTGPPAALVFRLEVGTELAGRVHLVTVLEDGRIITTSGRNPSVERRLTAAGVQLLRDELDATGLTFLASADYLPVSNPGVEPPVYGYDVPALEVGLPGGETAMITWALPPDTMRDSFQPQPEAEALAAMLARLISLDAWLPANAWADANARPYAPWQYRILISSSPCPPGSGCLLPVVESSTVSWPLIEGIDAFGAAVQSVAQEPPHGDGTAPFRCRVVSAREGAPVIVALESAGATFEGSSPVFYGGSFDLGYRATSRWVSIGIEPLLPYADASCGGVEITF